MQKSILISSSVILCFFMASSVIISGLGLVEPGMVIPQFFFSSVVVFDWTGCFFWSVGFITP
jgi:hypothetical protein